MNYITFLEVIYTYQGVMFMVNYTVWTKVINQISVDRRMLIVQSQIYITPPQMPVNELWGLDS